MKRHFLHIYVSGGNWHFSAWSQKLHLWHCHWQHNYAGDHIDWLQIKQNTPARHWLLLITLDHQLTLQQRLSVADDVQASALETYASSQLTSCFGQNSEQLVFDYLTLDSIKQQALWLVAMPRASQKQLLQQCHPLKHRPRSISVDHLVVATALPQFMGTHKVMTCVFAMPQQLWLTLYEDHRIIDIKLFDDNNPCSHALHQLQQWQRQQPTTTIKHHLISIDKTSDDHCKEILTLPIDILWWQPTQLYRSPWGLASFIAYCAMLGVSS
ncbi:MAG: hypothetical protein P1U63_10075 [Coxiellaceae bacterium]|nr:hypothetical protein [Coxiellaceae bacterium]